MVAFRLELFYVTNWSIGKRHPSQKGIRQVCHAILIFQQEDWFLCIINHLSSHGTGYFQREFVFLA